MRIALSDGIFPRMMAEVLIAYCQVRRDRIVDDRRNAMRLQVLLKIITRFCTDDVLVIHMVRICRPLLRQMDQFVAVALVVALRNADALGEEFIEMTQLRAEQCRLQLIQP